MCGRYYIDDEMSKDIRRICDKIDSGLKNYGRTGEIFPTYTAPILAPEDSSKIRQMSAIWGFPNFRSKGVIINARAETAAEKKTFRESLISRRCAVPASAFYEWDGNKNKIMFTVPHTKTLYMAGLFNQYQGECRFVILTTRANLSVEDVHDRMPLILTEQEIAEWVLSPDLANVLLHKEPPLLSRK